MLIPIIRINVPKLGVRLWVSTEYAEQFDQDCAFYFRYYEANPRLTGCGSPW